MSPYALSMSKLTPLIGQDGKTRFAFYSLRLLAWSNGLEAFVSCIALAYFAGFAIFGQHVAFQDSYPLAQHTAILLGVTGLLGVIGLNTKARWLRIGTSLTAFMCWGLLALGAMFEQVDLQQRSVFMLGVFALGELAVFMRLHLGMEQMQDTLDAAAYANNLSVITTGQPLPPVKPPEQDDGSSGRRT